MSQLRRFLSAFIIAFNVFANEDYVELPLNQGETISDLLYTKLGLSPIYFPGRVLKDVLIFNKLDGTKAKNLKTGFEVKIPKKFLKIIPEPETNPIAPQVENRPSEVASEEIKKPQLKFSYSRSLSLGVGALAYSGNSQAQGKFNGVASSFGGKFVHQAQSDKWHLRSSLELDQTYVKSPNLNITATSSKLLFAGMRRATDKFDLGPGAGLKRDFFIVINNNRKETIQYAYVPTLFVAGQYAISPSLFITGDLGLNLPTNSEEKLKIKTRPYALLELSKNFHEKYFALAKSEIESRRIDDSEQIVIKMGLSVGREF